MKQISKGKIWCFAVGQLGWSILSALISSWLVNFYQPDKSALEAGHRIYIAQGTVIFGVLTILGAITAFGRIFDAVTDPLIASASDRCRSKSGRRIPFMKWSALPFGVATVLVFWSPFGAGSADGHWGNAAFLFLTVTLFYLFMTMYCTPYNALIPELGSTQETRIRISTSISFTFIAGMAFAYLAPTIWGALIAAGVERMLAIRLTMTGLAALGVICMLVPVFTIRETDYVDVRPTNGSAFRSLAGTFRNKEFRHFVFSDVIYFLGITTFQTALPFFVTALIGLEEFYSTVFFVLMTFLSVCCYPLVGFITKKFGKKRPIIVAFGIFVVAFLYAALLGDTIGFIPSVVQGVILCFLAAPAQAIFGILPQACVADVAESDEKATGENHSGMFFAARTFAMKLGQSIAMLLVTALATVGHDTGFGYRLAAISAAVACVIGGVLFLFYNEKKVFASLGLDETGHAQAEPTEEEK